MVLGTRLRIAIRRTSNQLDLGLPFLIFKPQGSGELRPALLEAVRRKNDATYLKT
jgi:hypothetical protein